MERLLLLISMIFQPWTQVSISFIFHMWIRDISNKLNQKLLTEFLEFQDDSVGFVTYNQNQTQKARTIFHVLLVSVLQYLIIFVCDH